MKGPVFAEALWGAVVGAFSVCFAAEAEDALNLGVMVWVDPTNLKRMNEIVFSLLI